MGIYIKGMKLPSEERQGELLILTSDGRCVDIFSKEYQAVEVPPHGRLIDADALIADLKGQCKEVFRIDAVSPDDFWITRNEAYNERLWTTWCESLYDYINAAPTVIEAEDGT